MTCRANQALRAGGSIEYIKPLVRQATQCRAAVSAACLSFLEQLLLLPSAPS